MLLFPTLYYIIIVNKILPRFQTSVYLIIKFNHNGHLDIIKVTIFFNQRIHTDITKSYSYNNFYQIISTVNHNTHTDIIEVTLFNITIVHHINVHTKEKNN